MAATSLRAALAALPLSDHGDDPFIARLAREQRWSPAHARLVVSEYRRFLELAATCDHRVVPSPAIDAVWHLHLLHTRAYWDGLCGGVLGRPLHHDPNAPGAPQAESKRDRQRTLAAYRQGFGEPPAVVWGEPLARRWPVAAAAGALVLAGLGGCTSGDGGWWFAAVLVMGTMAAIGLWVFSALRQDRHRSFTSRRTDSGGAGGGGGSDCGVHHGEESHGHGPAGGTSDAGSGASDGGGGDGGGGCGGGGCGGGGCGGGGD